MRISSWVISFFIWYPCVFSSEESEKKMKELSLLELEKNPAVKIAKESEFVAEYFSIPTDHQFFHVGISSKIHPRLKKSVLYKKATTTYARWFVNPDDTIYKEKFKQELEKQNLSAKIYSYSKKGFRSASRSCFLTSEESKKRPRIKEIIPFSFKSSTNDCPGNWKDKKVNGNQVRKALLVSNLSEKIKAKFNLGPLKTLDEPVGFTFGDDKFFSGGLNQGIVFRDYSGLENSILIPGFSAIHNTYGVVLAQQDKEDENTLTPSKYWLEHYAKPLARAHAYFIFYFQLVVTSNHSQQFLIELTGNKKPTGSIYFRDYNDSNALAILWNQKADKEFLDEWMDHFIEKDQLRFSFGIFHGSEIPSWLGSDINDWRSGYIESFEKTFAELLGVDILLFKKSKIDENIPYQKTDYAHYNYNWNHEVFKNWVNAAGCFRGMDKLDNGLLCSDVLDCFKVGENMRSSNGYLCEDIRTSLEKKSVDLHELEKEEPNIVKNTYEIKGGLL